MSIMTMAEVYRNITVQKKKEKKRKIHIMIH